MQICLGNTRGASDASGSQELSPSFTCSPGQMEATHFPHNSKPTCVRARVCTHGMCANVCLYLCAWGREKWITWICTVPGSWNCLNQFKGVLTKREMFAEILGAQRNRANRWQTNSGLDSVSLIGTVCLTRRYFLCPLSAGGGNSLVFLTSTNLYASPIKKEHRGKALLNFP